jgi:hypothetical protein
VAGAEVVEGRGARHGDGVRARVRGERREKQERGSRCGNGGYNGRGRQSD